MEHYPTELTSPPVPLVALIGKPEQHLSLGDFLRSQNVPRIHSIGIPDAHSAAGTFGVKKAIPSSSTTGILKAGWLHKHRSSRPAVAALLIDRESVVGDPSAWAWLVSQLEAVKSAAKSHGARVVIIIVQQPGLPATEMPEDRFAMICRQAGVERRCVLNFAPAGGLAALQLVGKVLHNQAVEFYMADGQRRLAAHTHRNIPSADLNLRTAFKLGALAEFRGAWAAALGMYREAYGYVPQLLAGCAGQPQRFAEVRTVAEYVHVKVASLLLLALKQLSEALAQFESHLRLFRRVPFQAPPGLLASHHAWLCRQHTVMAELVMSSGTDLAYLKREQQPGQLFLAAARAAIERRKVAGFISGMHGSKAPPLLGRVEQGLFVGQLMLFPADPAAAAVAAGSTTVAATAAGLPASSLVAAAATARRLSEDQFEAYLEAEEARVQHSKATIELLRTAQETLQGSGRCTGKTLQYAMQLLGHELLEAGDVGTAECLLTEVAGFYRRERWEASLASTLVLLRECRQHEHNLQAHAELSLELSVLEDSSLDMEQRGAMATAAVSVLALGEDGADDAQQQEQGMQYSVATTNSGWLTVLPLCAGFLDPTRSTPAPAASTPRPAHSSVRFAAAVWNNAPIDLPLAAAQLRLRDTSGTFTATLPPEGSSDSRGTFGPVPAGGLVLPTGAWLRLAASVPVRCSGQLQATALVLRFGAGARGNSITFQLPVASQQTAAHAAAVGWLRGGWASSKPPFSATSGFMLGQYSIEVPPQHAPPLLLLQAPEVLLQGEQAAVTVTVVTAGADAINGAMLRGKAVHAESQQQLGLVVMGVAHGLHAGKGAETGSGGNAGLVQQLGDLAPGEQRQLILLLDARYRGAVHLSAELTYMVAANGGRPVDGGAPEAGHCAAALTVQVQLPWNLGLQLLGPPATHTLLAAPAPAGPVGSSTGSEAGAEILLLEQQHRRLQGLSVQEAPAPPTPATEAALGDGAKDLSSLLLHSLPPRFVLPAGQRCSALVQLQSLATCQLDVLAVELEVADGVEVLLAAAVPLAEDADSLQSTGAPADTLARSDIFAAAFVVTSSSAAAAELPSLGLLRLRWRRHQRHPPLLAAAARGASRLGAAAAKVAATEVLIGSASSAGSGSPLPAAAPACEVLVSLPAVGFLQPLLTAFVDFPLSATAGWPTELQLLLRNDGGISQEVAVAVGDPHCCLLAGPKATRVQLLPHSSIAVSWHVVPYHTGLLRLPEVTATAVQHGQAVEVTHGCSTFVEHPPDQVQHREQREQ